MAKLTGEKVKSIREKHGMARHEFAAALGYDGTEQSRATQIYRIESGQRAIPDMVELAINFVQRGVYPESWPADKQLKPKPAKKRKAKAAAN